MDKNILCPYVRLATYSTLTVPYIIKERSIFDYEIIFVQNGGCIINIEGVDYKVKKNDVIFLPPRVHHSFHVTRDNFVQPHIHFDAVYTEKSRETPISFKKDTDMTDYEKTLFQPDIFAELEIPYVFTPKNPASFCKTFFMIIDLYTSGERGLYLKSQMLLLLDALISQSENETTEEAYIPDGRISTIKEYIDANFMNTITLDGLAEQFSINKFTMLRKFKASYGKSIISYYNHLRCENAKLKLRSTKLQIKEIGASLSFSDEYTFSRFFKSMTGDSPLTYRKNKH